MITVEEAKAFMANDRKDVRDKVTAHLQQHGAATTQELRRLFPNYAGKWRRAAFWHRLEELKAQRIIFTSASLRVSDWQFPHTVWSLTDG